MANHTFLGVVSQYRKHTLISPRRISNASRSRLLAVEALNNLPWATYLSLVDIAIKTGFVPKLNQHGQPTGEFDKIDGDARLALIETWGRKLISDAPKEINVTTTTPTEVLNSPSLLDNLPIEELRKLAEPQTYQNDVS
jgi:hypothetical protein